MGNEVWFALFLVAFVILAIDNWIVFWWWLQRWLNSRSKPGTLLALLAVSLLFAALATVIGIIALNGLDVLLLDLRFIPPPLSTVGLILVLVAISTANRVLRWFVRRQVLG